MPVNKKDNKKNATQEERDSALVPTKDSVGKKKPTSNKTLKETPNQRINALSTVGEKKKPK